MDWKIIIAEIQRFRGFTQPQIAKHCGCGQATISDLANGKTQHPSHPLGEALRALHRKALRKQRAEPKQPQAHANITQPATENIAEQGA